MWKISFVLVAILLGLSTTMGAQDNNDVTPPEQSPQSPAQEAPRRLSITLQVNNPDEILVKEGDRLVQGQVVARNIPVRKRAEEQQQELNVSIAQLTQPLPKPPPPPPPSFAAEDAAIASAKLNIEFLDAQPEPQFFMKTENLIQVFEADKLQQKQEIAQNKMNGHLLLNQAIANRQEAEASHQRELYQHQLKLLEIDQENRRRSTEAIRQREKLAVIENTIAEADFKSPYSGTVRKVKVLGQNGRLLNVEILLINSDLNG